MFRSSVSLWSVFLFNLLTFRLKSSHQIIKCSLRSENLSFNCEMDILDTGGDVILFMCCHFQRQKQTVSIVTTSTTRTAIKRVVLKALFRIEPFPDLYLCCPHDQHILRTISSTQSQLTTIKKLSIIIYLFCNPFHSGHLWTLLNTHTFPELFIAMWLC